MVSIVLLFSCEKRPQLFAENKNQVDEVYTYFRTFPLPANLNFCGERVPLEDWEVKERFERELYLLLQQPGQIILYLKRSEKYFPIYEKFLKENKAPLDLKYLSVAESALFMSRSAKGAVGLWQFMPETAKQYGLEISSTVDERKNVEKSTYAAIRYLQNSYRQTNSWTSAAASFNMGLGGLSSNMNFQQERGYYDLFLNEETSRYIFRILVIKEVMENSRRYGFLYESQGEGERQPEVRTIQVHNSIYNLADWARNQRVSYKMLKVLNPWFISNHLNATKAYQIQLPK